MSTDNCSAQDSPKALIKSTSILSLGTLTSRILGFIRDVVIAGLLGTGFRADAFFVAFKIPNLLRNLVGEGAVNSTVVPVLSEYVDQREELWRLINLVFSLSLMILSAITLLGILLTPWIVRVIAPGFIIEPEKLLLAIRLTKIMFPYLIFVGLTAYSMGVLYTFRSFWAPAFGSCFLNISVIGSAWFAYGRMEDPVYGLAWGVLIGGALQFSLQMIAILKSGPRWQRPKTLIHPGAQRIGQLLVPRMFGSGIYQLNIFVDTFCASLATIVGQGGISAIYYANRIIQFPMGIFVLALTSAVLPTMSVFAAKKKFDEFQTTLMFSLKNVFFIMIPVSIFLMILVEPIIHILFERGAFKAYSTQITSGTLFWYATGLVSFAGVKILATAFHSLQDTSTPAKAAGIALLINVVLNVVLMHPLQVGGIALASSIAAAVNFGLLFFYLKRRLQEFRFSLGPYLGKILLSSLLMGLCVDQAWHHLRMIHEIIRMIVVGLVAGGVFLSLSYILKVEQVMDFKQWILKKK